MPEALNARPSPTPIQPILIGEADAAMAISAALEARGIFVGAIRPPTVPAGSARLRVTLSAGHSEAQVDELLEALGQVIGAQVIDAQAGGAPGT
jgi:8-amino-7-oxononanoate synthase